MNGPAAPDNSARRGFSLRRFIVRRLRFLAVAMPLCCAALLLPVEGWLFELLRQFRLWNAVIGIGTGVLLLLFRDWKFAVIALAAGIWQGWPVVEYRQEVYNGRRDDVSLTLLTCNLLYECREPERMIASLREVNPDVLLLLEFTPEWQGHFKEALWKDYPHRVEEPQPGYSGICLASKLPLEAATVLDVAGRFPAVPVAVIARGQRSSLLEGIPVIRATINIGKHSIALLGVHPPPPMRPELHVTWHESFAAWPALLRDARAQNQIIAGDLNTTPFTRTFARLCAETGLHDSALGFGLTNTWHFAGTPLGLPLDHVLVSRDLAVLERTIGPEVGSDHRWVMVKLSPGS